MAKFDLTTKNCEFLDRHLTFPLLEFLLSKDVNITIFPCFTDLNKVSKVSLIIAKFIRQHAYIFD